MARLSAFFRDLKTSVASTPGTTVLVSHGGALSSLVNLVMLAEGHVVCAPSIEPSRFWNCSISEILFERDPPTIVRWADIAHLDASRKLANVDEAI